MASVNDVILEMVNVEELLRSAMDEVVKENMVDSLATKINSLAMFDVRDALELIRALETASMSDDVKAKLQAAIDARLSHGLHAVAGGKSKTATQKLNNTLNFLTQGDWNVILQPSATPHQIMAIIAARLSKLGIRSLHEQTVKWPVVVVLYCIQRSTGHFPKYKVLRDYVEDFKKEFEAFKTP